VEEVLITHFPPFPLDCSISDTNISVRISIAVEFYWCTNCFLVEAIIQLLNGQMNQFFLDDHFHPGAPQYKLLSAWLNCTGKGIIIDILRNEYSADIAFNFNRKFLL